MRTFNQQVSTAVPLNVSSNGVAIPLKNIFMFALSANVTGTPTGTIKLQVSNDPETNDTQPSANPRPIPTHWVDLANSSFSLSASGETMWNVQYVGYNWVRVVYTDGSSGSSTATMTIIMNGKGS